MQPSGPMSATTNFLATGEREFDTVRRGVGLGEGHEVVIVPSIDEGVAEDEEGVWRCLRWEKQEQQHQ